ncbi:MAG TPA: hypothetical protein VFK88_05290 [Gallionella sp.]|nr:hypothetical protein [Gallionella sp.]
MAVDPSIAMGVRPIQLSNPLEQYMQVQQIQGAQNQNRLADLMYGEKQREVQQNLALNDIYKNATNQDGTIDRTKLYGGITSSGLGSRLPAVQKAMLDTDQTQANIDNLRAKTTNTTTQTAGMADDQREKKRQRAITDIAGFKTPQEAMANLDAHEKAGDLTPENAAAIRSTIPTNSADFPKWQVGMLQRIISAGDAMKQLSPDANAKLQSDTSLKTANIQAQTAANRLAFDKSQADTNQDAPMDPLAVRMTAQQYLAGDSSALQNFGRGAQGAANLNAVRLEVAKQANAAGMNGADIAAKMAEFAGLKAGQRTAGTRSASIEIAANEVAQLAPIALDASAKVSRSGFLPFGKAQIMFDANTNDPAMRQFAMANTALVNAYGQAMARNGTATVSDKDHARELLSTAFDQPSYAAAVAQLQRETRAAQAAPKQVRKDLSDSVAGREPAAPNAVPDDIAALLKKHGGK